jgi:hypothetical protein
MLSVIMLNVDIWNVVMLSFVGPQGGLTTGTHATRNVTGSNTYFKRY